MEGMSIDGIRRKRVPVNRDKSINSFEKVTSAKIDPSKNINNIFTKDPTRNESQKKIEDTMKKIEYDKLTSQLDKIRNEMAEIIRNSIDNNGKIKRADRLKMKKLKNQKTKIEAILAENTNLRIWDRGDDRAVA